MEEKEVRRKEVILFEDLDNVPIFFDEETEEIFFKKFCNDAYKIFLHNGYLGRTLKEKYNESLFYGQIYYFHRFIFGNKVKGKEVHHINGNKLDNRKENLQILESIEHQKIHQEKKRKGYWKAMETFATKKYGGEFEWNDGIEEEFNEWIKNKNEENY